ncbi:hypothetical protein [Tahibacter soli]|uniref:Uncharacterized protein n=1 Tax=Tahibacter soli TaxID=2983605 RepID=A0A9X3YKL1_9GAMM|nr:hypothetical protein [Tahibacter soli]MDC8012940.1 hypothetical protein [Tahibacter soli]
MSLESFENRAMLLKLETVENTDAAPTATANAFQLMNGRSGLQADSIKRQLDRPFFGGDPSTPVNIRGFIEGEVEMVGALTPGQPSPLSPLLQVCGMAETLVTSPAPALARYNVISRGIPSASSYFFHAGTLKKLLGARGNLSGLAYEIGKTYTAKLRLEGNCIDVEEDDLPSDLDYDAFVEPMPYTTEYGELKVNGFNVDGISLSVDFGNELAVKQHTEARIARISDRKPTFTVRFYRPAHANLNAWALWKSRTILPIVASVGIGAGAGRGVRTLLRAQIVEPPQEVEHEKDTAVEIKGELVPSSSGNDELVFEFLTLP